MCVLKQVDFIFTYFVVFVLFVPSFYYNQLTFHFQTYYSLSCACFRRPHIATRFLFACCSWYREGTNTPLQAIVRTGGSKDQPTNATLTLQPRREDDGAKYKCVVRNRAMNDGQRLEATATLNVNCK
ncbi:unnamed protein product [Ceratitis capitata]|uniref:(Mediterranean fruit fly) hypothetical protein n=1 Tax=Ceratitis capitata TaxID=7213 RepID=A0A811UPP7_CERCA|nr:unnamed protein product [Ceratitis capitata]